MIRTAITPKPKLSKCKVCHESFGKKRSIQPTCDKYECMVAYANKIAAETAEARAVKYRKTIKARKIALKTRSDWLKEAQVAFNAFVRERDKNLPCICCGRTSEKQYLTGSNWDCGHYRSTGSAPHLRFNENNAHRQLTVCNRHGAGRAVDYRIGLIKRIGLAAVEALEADQTPRKWTIDELKAIRDLYRAKLKELKAGKLNA